MNHAVSSRLSKPDRQLKPGQQIRMEYTIKSLKVRSYKLYNNYMITSTRITNTEIFAFIRVLVSKLLSRKASFINRKDNRNC